MASTTKLSFIALIKGAWLSTSSERARFWTFVLLFIAAYSLDLLSPWAIGYILDVYKKHGFTSQALVLATQGLLAYTAIRLGYTVCHHLGRYIQVTVAYTAKMNTLTGLFSDLLKFSLRWHIDKHSGESLTKLNRSAGAVDMLVGTYIWQIIEGLVKIIFAGVALSFLDFWVAVNVLALSLLTVGLMIVFNRLLLPRLRSNNAFYNKLNRISVDYLSNIVTVKTLGLEDSARKYLTKQVGEGAPLVRSIASFMELKWGVIGVGYALMIGSSLFLYLNRNTDTGAEFDVGHVYVMLNYLDRIFQAIGSFTGYYSGLVEAATAYEDATDIQSDALKEAVTTNQTRLPKDWQALSLKNLNFSYVDGERIGLRDVAVELKQGEKIALVGPSGGGKSTLLKIMAGILKPETIEISSETASELTVDDITKTSLLIPQEPEIFSETVRYNLTMGSDFDTKELTFFVSLCRLDSLLAKLPNGWDSELMERGHNLSVGERQRVALARGLLRASGKNFILLDEPTSSLDPKTEKEIFHGLLYHFADRTVLSACHRLNLVPLFDKIILVMQGQIVEVGSFQELMERRGHFFRAWEDYQSRVAKEQQAV